VEGAAGEGEGHTGGLTGSVDRTSGRAVGGCMFPIVLALRGRPCLVVGGGGVALRKVESLLEAGARVTVVALAPCSELAALAAAGQITLECRAYRAGEAAGYRLVFAATDDRSVNAEVFRDGEAAGVFVNVADDPALCSFHVPARLQRGNLQLAIASGGEAPFVVRRLRQLLERRLGPEWGEWADAAARFRAAVRGGGRSPEEQEALFDTFFTETVDGERLRARVPTEDEVARWLGAPLPAGTATPGTGDAAGQPRGVGFVSLVGGGPGDPGLLTVKGMRRLLTADAIVYDRLAATALPPEVPATVELHCVGKEAGHHPVPQEEINRLLIRLARQGKRVVRLKGGDPYVFGRGGEEAEALREAGVPFEVVPGVTAAVGVAAYAGIPVTHRGEAVRLTLVTAHESAKDGGPQVRWELLAADPHATLVGYMGVTSLPRVVERLLAAGMDPTTPAAVVERGTMARQRCIQAELARLPLAAEAAGIEPPALFVIGKTVAHMARLDWFSAQPLAGERLVVPAREGDVAAVLEAAGAELVLLPSPPTPASRAAISATPVTGCVAATAGEVEELDACRASACWSGAVPVVCLSAAAAQRARALGLGPVLEVACAEEVVAALRRGSRANG